MACDQLDPPTTRFLPQIHDSLFGKEEEVEPESKVDSAITKRLGLGKLLQLVEEPLRKKIHVRRQWIPLLQACDWHVAVETS